MGFIESFDQTEIIYQDVCKKIANPQNFFFTRTYMDLRSLALAVSNRLDDLINQYITVLIEENEIPEFRNVYEYMGCFSKLLKLKEYEKLSGEKHERICCLIATTARLGLMAHLFLVTAPTREEWYEKVDLEFIRREWLENLLRMKQIIKRYDSNIKNIPGKIFDGYYEHYIKPVLDEDFSTFNVIKVKKQQNYFKKIYFGGVLLGLEADFATRKAKAVADNNNDYENM